MLMHYAAAAYDDAIFLIIAVLLRHLFLRFLLRH